MYRQTPSRANSPGPTLGPLLGAVVSLALVAAPAAAFPLDVRSRLGALLKPPLVPAQTSIAVVDALTGAVEFQRNPDIALIPASTAKLYVGAVALVRLGGDFRFATPIVTTDANLSDGSLDGDLCIAGRGDPTWDDETVQEIVASLSAQGVTQIVGSVVCDDTLFGPDRLGEGWTPENLPWYFAPEASTVCFQRNRVDLTVAPGPTAGSKPKVELKPATTYLTVENTARTVARGTRSRINLSREQGSTIIRVKGALALGRAGFTQGMSVPRPALHAAHVLTHALSTAGIEVIGKPKLAAAPGRPILVHTVRSPRLLEIIADMEKRSDNHAAEQLLRTLGQRFQDEGTARAGLRTIEAFLREHEIDHTGCHLVDGSGLSRLNRLTATGLTSLLTRMWSLPEGRDFADALSVAGADGTLRRRMADTPAEGVVRAKTGTLRGACALAGYVFANPQRPLVFAFLANGHRGGASPVRRVQDNLCAALVTAARSQSMAGRP